MSDNKLQTGLHLFIQNNLSTALNERIWPNSLTKTCPAIFSENFNFKMCKTEPEAEKEEMGKKF